VQAKYIGNAKTIDYTDGVSMEFSEWRLNLRTSNTEPLIRLNVESRRSIDLMTQKTGEILEFLRDMGAESSDH
jgi:phosphomannomutase